MKWTVKATLTVFYPVEAENEDEAIEEGKKLFGMDRFGENQPEYEAIKKAETES